MLRIDLKTQISLRDRDIDRGFVSWVGVDICQVDEDERDESKNAERIGEVLIGLVHVAAAHEAGYDIAAVLEADSSELEALYDVYFEGPWFKEELTEGFGSDLLYIADVSIEERYEGRNLDLAVIRRILDTVGQSCMLAVIQYESRAERDYWARMGFEVSTKSESRGLMHLHQGYTQPQIVDSDERGHFEVVPVVPEEKRVGRTG
jgi:hypothetical protein